jgi:Periplasmic binding protein
VSRAQRFGPLQTAVLVTPLSGPLGRFGRCGSAALQLWAETAGVALEVIDAHPSTLDAVATAEAGRPDVLFGPYGTGPAVAAARASVGVVWNHGGATARLARPAFERVVNLPSPAGTYLAAVLDTLVADGLPAGSEIVLLYGQTGFGREVADGTAATAARLGLVLHPVSFPPGQGPAAFERAPRGDVLLSAGSFDDDAAIANVALRRRRAAVGLVAAGVDELTDALGGRVEGLYGPCQWMADTAPELAEGPDADWFVTRYRRDPAVPGRRSVRRRGRLAALHPRRQDHRSSEGARRLREPRHHHHVRTVPSRSCHRRANRPPDPSCALAARPTRPG